MSSIQERLQLKRAPLDNWNTREQLCLASAVVRSGDQNWMSVSRALKGLGEANRPPDWYSQKSCAAQYGALLEHVETPKRKKRTSEGGVETPQENILKRLTQERISEIQKKMAELSQLYHTLKAEANESKSPSVSEERLRELNLAIETERKHQEREQIKHQQWLREREERRIRAEKAWRPTLATCQTPPPTSAGSPGSSPLLTSLLKSSSSPVSLPLVTTPSLIHIPHHSSVIDTMSPSAGAPTLSMLLEKPSGSVLTSSTTPCPPSLPDANENAVIEHIKSQLQEIENQLNAASSPVLPAVPTRAGAVPDLDDIEIKAEDVYAFSDIDLEIPPVSTIHKNNSTKISEKPKFDVPTVPIEQQEKYRALEQEVSESIQEPQSISQELVEQEEITVKDEIIEENTTSMESQHVEEQLQPEPPIETEETMVTPQTEVTAEEATTPMQSNISEESEQVPATSSEVVSNEESAEKSILEESEIEVETEPQPQQMEKPPEAELAEQENVQDDQIIVPDIKHEFEEPAVTSPQEPTSEEAEVKKAVETAEPKTEVEDAIETDDDTPMEVVREEEKLGRKRKDYSRRRTDVSDDDSTRLRLRGSGSECSAPGSPTAHAADAERDHRLWKKSVMLVYSRLCAHKCASLFLRPITDEMAPGYSLVVRKPMDLTTIRKNIDTGIIRTTAEFQRDVLLMLSNALMYNSSSHRVHQMAREMHDEAVAGLGVLVQAQAHASLASAPVMARGHKRKAAQLSSPASLGATPAKRKHE